MQDFAESQIKRVAEFLFEAGMLRKIPRSGYHFLGSGHESVAEHSFRTTVIGYVLARMTGADWTRVVLMCLFHDLPEARTGDFNYVNKMYNQAAVEQALLDALGGTGLTEDIHVAQQELEEAKTEESVLAQDADQLDLILSLKEEQDLGNPYAEKWIEHALKRLRTASGNHLAAVILQTDHTDWWFKGVDVSWWANKNGQE
ncbi:MAG: HD domain-containing protein [Desulfohalobiaceae bacterium]|nr:HD domain-containing protein [Desulfohalobiaceae bacterium]